MAITFPDPTANECPQGCGVKVVAANENGQNTKVHAGTWQPKCTPKR